MPERQRVDLVVERLNSEFEGLVRMLMAFDTLAKTGPDWSLAR